MKTLTAIQCAEWCKAIGVPIGSDGKPVISDGQSPSIRFEVPKGLSRVAWFCRFVEATLQPRERCLLWVSGWGVWPSSENWHLYYRLRQSYGDDGLLEERPGHLFLDYETADFVSFLQVGVTAGWDIQLIPSRGSGHAFISHDERIEFVMADPAALSKIEVDLTKAAVI